MKKLLIGKIKLKSPVILAPMVDVTDLPFRLLCKKAGASLVYTEMLYADAIIHENKKTLNLMKIDKSEHPIGIQVTGNNPQEFEKLIKYTKKFDLIDINCGCPSIKLIGSQAGSYLLNDPKKIGEMIKILKSSGKPVTAKIRLGFKNNNVVEIAKEIEKAGADALTIHARLAIHGNNIPADWNEIKKIKDILRIPVIGNGDVSTPEQAKKMLEIADGVMIARAAIGNPLIFKQILDYLKTGKYDEITDKQKIEQFKEYMDLAKKHEQIDLNRIKYLGGNFLRGLKQASKLRQELMKLKTFDQISDFVNNINI